MPAPKTIVGWLLACAVGVLTGSLATYIFTSNQGIHIQSFLVDTQAVVIGDKVTFSWNVTGATEVAFRFVHLPTGSNGDLWEWVYPDAAVGGLPLTGQWSYDVPIDLSASRFKFEIEAADERGNKVATRSNEITVKYRPCFDGTNECATPPVQTQVTLQAFEHGYMLRRVDTQTIYVLTSNPDAETTHVVIGWKAFADTWAADQRFELADQPPSGYLLPQARFTKIIASNYGLQHDLGWAVAPEITFEATIQQTRIACSAMCSPMLMIQMEDGRVLRLSAGDSALQAGHVWAITPVG